MIERTKYSSQLQSELETVQAQLRDVKDELEQTRERIKRECEDKLNEKSREIQQLQMKCRDAERYVSDRIDSIETDRDSELRDLKRKMVEKTRRLSTAVDTVKYLEDDIEKWKEKDRKYQAESDELSPAAFAKWDENFKSDDAYYAKVSYQSKEGNKEEKKIENVRQKDLTDRFLYIYIYI